jgi:fido (protein-threonine AMPylation protein)
MARRIHEHELRAVEDAVRKRENGASIADLAGRYASEAEKRSMHRRLAKLIELNRLRITGGGKGARYFLTDASRQAVPHGEERHPEEDALFVPLSDVGQELQEAVQTPVGERAPAAYKRRFISNYLPNNTFYLSSSERRHLAEVNKGQLNSQPAGAYARQILNSLLIDFSWNSSRLSGSAYTIADTQALLETGQRAEGKSAEDAQNILNHKDAIEFLVEAARDIGFNDYTILNLHSFLSDNLLQDPQASGRLRTRGISTDQSPYTPLATPAIIQQCFSDLLAKACGIHDPFEQAFFVFVQLPYLQPFENANERVARLAANIPLIKKNLCPLSFADVPQTLYRDAMLSVYELNKTELARDVFVWAYERSAKSYAAMRQSPGAPDLFRMQYREPLRSAISAVITQQLSKAEASQWIEAWSRANMPAEDRSRFIEAVEADLLGLHDGNFARYKVKPSEFSAWKQAWVD